MLKTFYTNTPNVNRILIISYSDVCINNLRSDDDDDDDDEEERQS